MKKKKILYGIIIIVITIIIALIVVPKIVINETQKYDLQVLHSDYVSAKEYIDNKLEYALFFKCDPTTYSYENEGKVIEFIVKEYSDYVEERYEYYKEIIQNADYSSGYRYNSEDFINDFNNFDPYSYSN